MMSFIGIIISCQPDYSPKLLDTIPILVFQFGLLFVAFTIYYFSTKSKKLNIYTNPFKPIYKTLDVLGQERSSIVYKDSISLPQPNKTYPLWVRVLIGILILIFITTPILFQ